MFVEYFISILLAALVGGLIGIEREYRDKSAGFRTMILIAVGSALFTILSDVIGGPDGESSRVAAAVISGIGFLGAGAILKHGINVRGLTTAASIWLVASLGMGMGAGEYELVGAVTAAVLVVLWLLPPLEIWIGTRRAFPEFHITIKNTAKAEAKIFDIFAEAGVTILYLKRSREVKGERVLHIKAKTGPVEHEYLSECLTQEKSVLAFRE